MRSLNNRKVYRDYWWQFAEKRPALTQAIANGALRRALVVALVSKYLHPHPVLSGQVLAHKLAVFTHDQPEYLALLNSSFHLLWAHAWASTLESRLNYSPSDVYETLPQPAMDDATELARLGELLDATRSRTMLNRQLGLTRLYNAVHDASVRDMEIQQLRDLHEQIDHAVAEAYGWTALDLTHGFHQTRQGLRWTIDAAANTELLDRLLELNHDRHAAEISTAKGSGRSPAKVIDEGVDTLF